MSESTNSQASLEKNVIKKKRAPISLLVVLLLAVGLLLSVIFGVVYLGVKKPIQRVVVQTLVCDNENTLKKINSYLSDITNGDWSKVEEAIKYTTALTNYSSDPTCVEALARLYYMDSDSANLTKQLDRLDELGSKGQYPSNQFDGLTSVSNKKIDYQKLTGKAR